MKRSCQGWDSNLGLADQELVVLTITPWLFDEIFKYLNQVHQDQLRSKPERTARIELALTDFNGHSKAKPNTT